MFSWFAGAPCAQSTAIPRATATSNGRVAGADSRKPSAGKSLQQHVVPGPAAPNSATDTNDSYFWIESQPTHNFDDSSQKPQRLLHRA
jgi:hypothetical protein